MKTYILMLVIVALSAAGLQAQNTNSVIETNSTVIVSTNTVTSTNDPVEFDKVDITLSAAGTSFGGHNEVGIDVSLSVDPFESLPNLWVGVSQSLYWQPMLAGSTDVDVDWVFHIYKNLYANPGWSIGDVYGANTDNLVRTGPELFLQYYFTDNSYLYAGVNYDLVTEQSGQWTTSSDNNGWRWSIGIGLEW